MAQCTLGTILATLIASYLPYQFEAEASADRSLAINAIDRLKVRLAAASTSESKEPQPLFSVQCFDRHGRPDNMVLELIATDQTGAALICHELATTGAMPTEYRSVLSWCLGAIKDPSTARWIGDQLAEDNGFIDLDRWLDAWSAPLPLSSRGTLGKRMVAWLRDDELWSKVFLRLLNDDQHAAQRERLLRIAHRYLYSSQLVSFCLNLRTTDAPPKTVILNECVLVRWGYLPDRLAIADALANLQLEHSNPGALLAFAVQLPIREFVPHLITLLEKEHVTARLAESALRRITLQPDVCGAEEWNRWWSRHGHEAEYVWEDMFRREVRHKLQGDPVAACDFLIQNADIWSDARWLCDVEEWAEYPMLAEVILSWAIDVDSPIVRSDLLAIVTKVTGTHGLGVDDELRRSLELQRLSAVNVTWRDVVYAWDTRF